MNRNATALRPRRTRHKAASVSQAASSFGFGGGNQLATGVTIMPEKDVNSPVNTRNTTSKLSGNIPGFSPGAKSAPGRGDQATSHEPEPPLHERVMQQGA